jgi:hypothetical protein
MRFFLVRLIIFTILFTLLLLLLSWIAPIWTGNTINQLTSRWPTQEYVVDDGDNLIITDFSFDVMDETEKNIQQSTHTEDNTTTPSAIDEEISHKNNKDTDDNKEQEEQETHSHTTIIVDKVTDYDQETITHTIDTILSDDGDVTHPIDEVIEHTTTNTINTTTEDTPTKSSEEDSHTTNTSSHTLSPEEKALLEEFEKHTY